MSECSIPDCGGSATGNCAKCGAATCPDHGVEVEEGTMLCNKCIEKGS